MCGCIGLVKVEARTEGCVTEQSGSTTRSGNASWTFRRLESTLHQVEQEQQGADTACHFILSPLPVPDLPRWSTPPPVRPLKPDVVHIWRASLRVDAEALIALLAPDERDRARCFRFERDREAFIVARGTLRLVLSRYLGIAPEDLVFRYGDHGKPELAMDSDVQFNLSHAGDVALIAVARSRQLGVDVEPIRALPDADRIVERFFSSREVAVYRSLPSPARPEAFFTCWTRKEAFIKALGDGLTHPLDAFDVTVCPEEPAALRWVRGVASPPPWHFEALSIDPGYAATVVVEGAPCPVTCWDSAELVDTHASSMLASV